MQNPFRFAIIPLALSLVSCGKTDGFAPTNAILPAGSSAIFDAASSATPDAPCANTSWRDTSGNGLVGTLNACTAGTSGWRGSGSTTDPFRMLFDGSNYVTTGLDVQQSAMASTTWMAWVSPTGLPPGGSHYCIMGIDNNGGALNRNLGIAATTSRVFSFTGAGGFTTTMTAVNNTWQFMAVVYSPTNITVYRNGTAESYNTAPNFPATSLRLTIGKSNGGAGAEAFRGSIAWLAVYNRELSASEIKKACRSQMNRFAGASCD